MIICGFYNNLSKLWLECGHLLTLSLLKKITVQSSQTACCSPSSLPLPNVCRLTYTHTQGLLACSLQLPYSALTPEAGYIRPRPRSRPSLSVTVRLGPVHVASYLVSRVLSCLPTYLRAYHLLDTTCVLWLYHAIKRWVLNNHIYV